ncbi:hypothetical protein PCASD_16242 [Puccinia coronata f. sp. avenae]|uniref:mannan endo-1,6-alpha-mannosidase n=1 Tax=Puccinia coronata f. sp. avenae TaxID=200324 RepID=A0A2N5TU83_9BASI|nr:hypothetical protein PCASD_16242 [Puccinia coronata f. sp. avenae]
MRYLHGIMTISLILTVGTSVSENAPSLDVKDIPQLKQAVQAAMRNLMSYFTPNDRGTFNETETPWHESGMIWSLNFDYARWTGDTQYLNIVTQALFNQSNGIKHDFLDTSTKQQWNDAMLWPNGVPLAAAEFYGRDSRMPNSDETWMNLVQKTFEEVGSQRDDKCGGGIYWYRDREDKKGSYKALITHSQFIQQGARSYIITHDTNTLDQAKSILEWVISSGLANPDTGLLLDGTSTTDCKDFTTFQWSYNYGQWLGSLASMHKASQDQRYLDMAIPFLNYSQNTFAATNTSGIVAEISYVRNLAYLHSETNNSIMKQVIEKIIDTTVRAMVSHSCDSDWNCAGIWTSDKRSVTKQVYAEAYSQD